MRHLSLGEVLELHRRIVEATGGASGVRDLGALESALAQPRMTFGGHDLYADLPAKAAALGYSLIQIGHAATEALLMLNGSELQSTVEEAEQTILDVAAGRLKREAFTEWVRSHTRPSAP